MSCCSPDWASIPVLEGRDFLDVTRREALEVPALISLLPPQGKALRRRCLKANGYLWKSCSFGLQLHRSSGGQHVPSVMQHGMQVLKPAAAGSTGRAAPHTNWRCPPRSRTGYCCNSNPVPGCAGQDEARSAGNHAFTLFCSLQTPSLLPVTQAVTLLG